MLEQSQAEQIPPGRNESGRTESGVAASNVDRFFSCATLSFENGQAIPCAPHSYLMRALFSAG